MTQLITQLTRFCHRNRGSAGRSRSLVLATASAMSSVLLAPAAAASMKAFPVARMWRSRPLHIRLVIRSCVKTSVSATVQRKRLRANGINLVVDDQGDESATPVILLHGFPNRANLWERQVMQDLANCQVKHCTFTIARTDFVGTRSHTKLRLPAQIPSLLDESFRVIAPDLRGAFNGESDAPKNAKEYHMTDLVKDLEGTVLCLSPG